MLALAACASLQDPLGAERWPTPRRGMVVSEHALATRAGVEMLEAGGNAADAAVATALALAVVFPQAGNLGGGGFALWVAHDGSSAPLLCDFRESAPQDLRAEAFLDEAGRLVPERSLAGPLAPCVPGSPHGLWLFHGRLGRLPFERVAAPAIALARKGFAVDAALAHDLLDAEDRARLCADGMARELFYPRGEPLREGDLLRQEVLADTLERLVARGPSGFYEGDVAQAVVGTLRPQGGVLSLADLAGYRARWREPLRGWFRGLEIITVPPPSAGGLVLLQVLAMLDGFPLDEEMESTRARARAIDPGSDAAVVGLSGRAVHWWIEALRRSFADRAAHVGDPDYVHVPVAELLAPSWIAERRISIGELADEHVAPLLAPAREGGETTHLSVLDREGNAVSLTTTLNTSFGSGIMVRGGGFLLNNEVDDFALAAGQPNVYGLVGGDANALAPGKRPASSMAPTVVREGGQTVRMVLGSPGGPRIVTALVQVLLRTEVYGQPLAGALAAPRLHQQWSPASTSFEEGWDHLLLQDLRNRDHQVAVTRGTFGSVQAIRVEVGGDPEGASDPRRSGLALAEREP